jgi:Asp-tRNA(Asn)/Glu-tRNA(Gln) amidotransferase A subunit family amidase
MARDVDGCIELMRALAPSVSVPEVSLADLRVATAWGEVPVDGERVEFPTARRSFPVFAREVGDVHRELYAEHEELYGENIRSKVEMCIAVGDGEYEAALRSREELRERADEALAGFDLLVTPVLSCPVPPADCDELAVRAAVTLWTFPFNALGWPALAVGGTQIVGRPGADGLVLAAGRALEAAALKA